LLFFYTVEKFIEKEGLSHKIAAELFKMNLLTFILILFNSFCMYLI